VGYNSVADNMDLSSIFIRFSCFCLQNQRIMQKFGENSNLPGIAVEGYDLGAN